MNEESVIFGAKRHLYGGIEPDDMVEFTATFHKSWHTLYTWKNLVKMVVKLPDNADGCIIRRKLDLPPTDEFDGEFVCEITEDGTYYDIDIPQAASARGQVWVYAAFPYSSRGICRRGRRSLAVIVNNGVTVNSGLDSFTTYIARYDNKAAVRLTINYYIQSSSADSTSPLADTILVSRHRTHRPLTPNDGDIILEHPTSWSNETVVAGGSEVVSTSLDSGISTYASDPGQVTLTVYDVGVKDDFTPYYYSVFLKGTNSDGTGWIRSDTKDVGWTTYKPTVDPPGGGGI